MTDAMFFALVKGLVYLSIWGNPTDTYDECRESYSRTVCLAEMRCHERHRCQGSRPVLVCRDTLRRPTLAHACLSSRVIRCDAIIDPLACAPASPRMPWTVRLRYP